MDDLADEMIEIINILVKKMDSGMVSDWMNQPNTDMNGYTPMEYFKMGESEKVKEEARKFIASYP